MISRRRLILSASRIAALSPILGVAHTDRPSARLKILLLGGTNFLGPAIVAAALAANHTVTLFNRGRTNPELFPEVEKLRGDRTIDAANLGALQGARTWDAVVDVWTDDARMVDATAVLLKERTRRYLYVSSIAAYADLKALPPITEIAPIRNIHRYEPGLSYSDGKALCERTLAGIMADRSIMVRPTSIVGDRDDEVTMVWWLWRIRRGGRILVPGNGDDAVQWIDVKDVGRFIVALIERDAVGSFNAVGPNTHETTFGDMIRTMSKAYRNHSEPVWVPKDFLYGLGLKSGTDLPLWRPSSEWGSFYKVSATKSLHAGLQYRPEGSTFADVLDWYDASHPGSPHPYLVKSNRGISAERESTVLAAWAQRPHDG